MNPTDQARDWIIQHLASTNNYPLLSTFYSSDSYLTTTNPHFDPKTTKLLTISTLKNKLQHTTYNNLIQLISPNNIFTSYHTLYPSILSNQQTITSLNKKETKDLSAWVARLFQSEIELKVQIILSTNYFRTNYIQHKKLNDELLHENHYKNPSNYNTYTPSESVIKFISQCANGMTYIRRIHQQLDYLGQQCTKPNINLNNNNDSTVKKINEFLKKHTYKLFKQKILSVFDIAQNECCTKGKDFLTRLAKADIHKIINGDHTRTPSPFKTTPKRHKIPITSPQQQHTNEPSPEVVLFKPTKYGLRTVVDVEIRGGWCSGTIIKRFNDGSIKIALHTQDMDENGKYKYDTHLRIKRTNLNGVVHCINEDGEYEIDDNTKLKIDMSVKKNEEFSSPIKQEEIRQEKEQLTQQSQDIIPFNKVLKNRNRNKNININDNVMRNLENELLNIDMDDSNGEIKHSNQEERIMEVMNTKSNIISQSSDITEPNLSNELSPNTIKKKRYERMEQFKVISGNNKRRSPSPRRRKRNRQEFEKKLQHSSSKKSSVSDGTVNPQKKRKIHDKKDEIIVPQRRQSQRLLARRNSDIERAKNKNKCKLIQTTIGAKDKKMTVNRNRNRNKNVNDKSDSESGEEQQWSDDMSDNMKKLNEKSKLDDIQNKRKKPKSKWTKDEENALKECYLKHDKARQLVKNYAIWDQIKRDSNYCHHWANRTSHALRDKARALLDLNKSKKD